MIRNPPLRSGRAKSAGTTAQQWHSLAHFASSGLGPAAIDSSLPTPQREALLGRYDHQLLCPLTQGQVVSEERKQHGAACEAHSQRRRISQAARLGDGLVAFCQRLIRIAETEQENPQEGLRVYVRVTTGVMNERAVRAWLIKRKRLPQMRLGLRELACKQQISTG